jgi:hypothetical protein
MTFEEWFAQDIPWWDTDSKFSNLPEDIRREIKILTKCSWEAGFQSGQDHQRELERLAEYDRSVFGDPDQGISGASGYTFRGL